MTTTASPSWSDSVEYCRAVTRRHARNFYYGMRLAPEEKRDALYVIYAWMRHADDLADDARDSEAARRAVEAYREVTDRALEGEAPNDDPALRALAEVARRFPLDPIDFHGLLRGQLDDLEGRTYDTFEELREYCTRVASTVGMVCIRIWGYDDVRAPALAVDRGIAFQLTNILRDVVEDSDRGRVYLPADELAAADLTIDALLAWSDPQRCRNFLAGQLARALEYYERSAELDGMIDPACRPTLWAMTEIYRRLALKMAGDPARIVGQRRIRLQASQKVAIAIRARWRSHAAVAP